jgi:hypothetical protein
MLQRFFGVSIGALITFLLLEFFIRGDGTYWLVGDATQAYIWAAIIGAVASFFWPIVIGWFLVRRHRQRQEDRVQAEVARQINEQQRPGG